MSQNIYKKLNEYKKHIESHGYNVYAIMLKGSQNYNLDDAESDIDANAILLPKVSQLKDGLTKKFEFDTGEVTCHDLFSFYSIVKKGNPQWVEVCHTPYVIGSSLDLFKDFKVNPSALKGMAYEKVKAFDKLYPSRKHMIDKYGYDPKQLHHIIRLYHIIKFDKKVHMYKPLSRDIMLKIKRGSINKDQAEIYRDRYMNKILHLAEDLKLKREQEFVQDITEELEYIYNDFLVEQRLSVKGKYVDSYIQQHRTFGTEIPNRHLKMFEELEKHRGEDISYTITSFLQIL